MDKKDIIDFLLDKAKENHDHIGMPQKIKYNGVHYNDIVLEDVNIYCKNGGEISYKITFTTASETIEIICDKLSNEYIPILVAIYKEIINNNYL